MLLTRPELERFQIDMRAIERLPESVGRERLALPVRYQDGTLHVILPVQAGLATNDSVDVLKLVLDCRFTYQFAAAEDLEALVDLFYTAAYSDVSNCGARFEFQCPKQWGELTPTGEVRVRNCAVCQRQVTFSTSAAEFAALAAQNECVAFFDPNAETHFLGLPHSE